MPRVSKATATNVQDIGIGMIRDEVVDGYEFAFLNLDTDADLAPMLKGLPDDRCPCPHWGYVTKGKVTFTFADHTEAFEAGDAFYVSAGHSPTAAAGTEFLLISPAEQIAEVNAAIQRNMALLQSS